MTTPETLGKRLFWARLQLSARLGKSVTQPDLGEMVGLTGATISRYEAGKQEPDLGIIVRLAGALGITPGWLAFGDAANLTTITNGGTIGGDASPTSDPAKPLPRLLPRPDAAAPKKGRGTA